MDGSRDTSWRGELAQAIEARIGMRLTGHALDSLESFVRGRLRLLELRDPRDYVASLLRAPDGEEARRLANAITNGETHFFRDEEQFAIVRRVLRELAAKLDRPVAVWSAGCASGEEAWSVGMVLAEEGIEGTVLGTDVNTEALELARTGRYGRWSLRRVPDAALAQYFVPEESGYRILGERLPMVRFAHHNLVLDPPPRPPGARWDVILCRNVFIYFPPELVQRTVRRMAGVLRETGWLFVGAAEPVVSLDGPLHPVEIGRRLGYRPGPPRRTLPAAVPPGEPTPIEPELSSPRLRRPRPPRGMTARPYAPAPAPTSPPRTPPAPAPAPPSLEAAAGALRAGEVETAEGIVREVLAERPDDVSALVLLGHVHLSRHAFDEALEIYGRVQERDALLPDVHYFEALVWRKLGDVGRAETALRRAVFLAPTFWEAAFMLAGVYERMGRARDARREYVRTVHVLDGGGADSSPVAFREGLRRFLPDPGQAAWLCRRQLAALGR